MSNISLVGYENMSCNSIYELFLSRYIKEFDLERAIKVSQEIESSSHIKDYINALMFDNLFPNYLDIVHNLNSSSYFLLSKGETICLASLIILEYWNQGFNENSKFVAPKNVTQIAINIINQCSRLKSDKADNLFTRFYQDIEAHLKLAHRKKSLSLENPNYINFIIKKSAGPFEFPLNLNPDYCYMQLELESDGDIYMLKEDIFYDYLEEDLEKFQVNKTYRLKISNYNIEQRGGVDILVKKR